MAKVPIVKLCQKLVFLLQKRIFKIPVLHAFFMNLGLGNVGKVGKVEQFGKVGNVGKIGIGGTLKK